MGSYYYLASQLPYLIRGTKPPMSSAEFKLLAETLMDADDADLLEHLFLDPDPTYTEHGHSTGSRFIDGWREWERTLRLNMARHRSLKLKRENVAMEEPPAFPVDAAAAAVKAVVATESPLEGEILIDRARWRAIDILAGRDIFHRNAIYAYYLKLLILERRQSFNAELGFAEYKSLYASIIERAQHSVGEPK